MRNTSAYLVLVLAFASLAGVASAQPPQQQMILPPPRHARGDLMRATQRVAQQAAYEAPRSRFAHAAQRLAQEAALLRGGQRPDAIARFEDAYVQSRRALTADRRFAPSDALLDAWDDVVVAYAPTRARAPQPQPLPQPQPYPVPVPQPVPQPGAVYQFDGRFEQTPVRLAGRTLEELDRSCMQFASAIDTRMVDDVFVGARNIHNGPSYWDAQALCSIVVLNATTERSYAPVHVRGEIEGVPFAVSGTADVVRRAIEQHVPRFARQMQIDDVQINGQVYRNGPAYWSPAQVVSLIVAQIPGGAGPVAPQLAAQGRIERAPFSFVGDSAAQIEAQCRAFVSTAAPQGWVRELELDGRQLRNPQGYWSTDDLCRLIATQARPI